MNEGERPTEEELICPECGSTEIYNPKEYGIKSKFQYKCWDCDSEFDISNIEGKS